MPVFFMPFGDHSFFRGLDHLKYIGKEVQII